MRRSYLVSLLGLCLVLLVCGAMVVLAEGETTTAAATNYAENGDFETGDYIPWSGYGAKLEIVTDDVHGGKYACKAYFDQEWGGGHYLTFRAPKGKYRVTMWVKVGPLAGGACWAGCKYNNKTDQVGTPSTIPTVGEWVPLTWDIKMKFTTAELWTWASKNTDPSFWLLLDDVSVVPIQ